jgi:hypothetical protein
MFRQILRNIEFQERFLQARFIISDGVFVFVFENRRFPIKYRDVCDIVRYSLSDLSFLDTKNSSRIKISSSDRNLQIDIENYQFIIPFRLLEDASQYNSEITIYDKNSNPPEVKKSKFEETLQEKPSLIAVGLINGRKLKDLHYIKHAKHEYPTGGPTWWMALYSNKIDFYNRKSNGNFLIIIFDSLNANNFYAIPFAIVKKDLYIGYLDKRDRWVLSIRDGRLCIHGTDVKIPVEQYHNNFPSGFGIY